MPQEEYRTTVALIRIPKAIPKFTIQKMVFLEKFIPSHKDIDYIIYSDFSDKFNVKVEDESLMKEFLNDDLKALIEQSDAYHLESNGQDILIFNDRLRISKVQECESLITFIQNIGERIK